MAQRYGIGLDRVTPALDRLEAAGRIVRGEFRPDGIEREWCDDEVLRQLRRRSLAALRKEVEPVDAAALARFLPEWQGVGAPRRGLDALVEAIGSLQGAALPASTLEADVLSARVAGYQPADLDALCTSGEVVWVGAGPLGPSDGRVRLLFRDQAALLAPPASAADAASAQLAGPVHQVLRAHLAASGASFWSDLVSAVASADEPADDAAVLDALWDLVWAGEVTNDAVAPLRALAGPGSGRRFGGSGRGRRSAGALRLRPQLGRPSPSRAGMIGGAAGRGLSRSGPPAAAGRWARVAPLLQPVPTSTEAAHAQALQLLERHGVLTREATLAEGVEGGFAAIYPVLKVLEDRGQVRRGYFVAGLGAAQFALPGAVDRLRAARDVDHHLAERDADTAGAGSHRSGPGLRRGARLARLGRPAGAQRRCLRRVHGRATDGRARAGGQEPVHLRRRGRSSRLGRGPGPTWSRTAACASSRSPASTVRRPPSRPWPTTCAPPVSRTATRA